MGQVIEREKILGLNFAEFAAQTFFTLLLIQVFSVVISIMTARLLGPEGKGIVAVLILCPTLLFTIGHLSIYRVLTTHISLGKRSLRDYCGTVAFFILGITVLLVGFFLLFYFLCPPLFIKNIGLSVILLALGILPFFLMIQIFSSILQTQEKIRQMNAVSIAQSVGALTSIIIFVFLLHQGVPGVILSYFIANLFSALLAINFVFRISPWPWYFNFKLLKELVADGVKLHVGVIAVFLFLKIDQLMLSYYKQNASVGYYTISVSLSEILLLIPLAIQNVFYAKISQLLANKEDMADKTLLVYKHNLLLLLVFSVVLLLTAKPLIKIFYGEAFMPSLRPFFILLPGAFFLYLNNVLTNYLVGRKLFLLIALITTLAAILNIGLNIVFIPPYGISGASLASTITYVLVGMAMLSSFLYFNRWDFLKFMSKLSFAKSDFLLYRAVFERFFGKDKKR